MPDEVFPRLPPSERPPLEGRCRRRRRKGVNPIQLDSAGNFNRIPPVLAKPPPFLTRGGFQQKRADNIRRFTVGRGLRPERSEEVLLGYPCGQKASLFSENHIDEAKITIHRAFSIIRLTKRKKKHKIVGGKIKREDFQR